MTNITFSVDDDLHKKMKTHPEIKWTEILRNAIVNYLKKIEEPDVITVEELRKNLDIETLQMIDGLNESEEIAFYEKAKKMEKERTKKLQELERRVEK